MIYAVIFQLLLAEIVDDVMTKNPQTAQPEMLASEAMDIMNRGPITVLMVRENNKPVGILHLHDLLRVGMS